jgi:hypothetical protein
MIPPVLYSLNTRVGFSTPNWFNPVSWLVRKITGSKVSHAWFLYHDADWDMEMVVEAHEVGFRLIPFERFKKYNVIVALYSPRRPIDEGLKKVAQKFLSTHYDYAGLIGGAVVALGKIFKRKWKNPFRSSTHVYCSEAMALAMKWSPGYEDLDVDTDMVEPRELNEYFAKDGSIVAAVA